MKKFYILLLILFAEHIVKGQSTHPCVPCLPQGITFTTQSQIDSFPVNYPNCDQIEGEITIGGNDITNLDSLIGLSTIGKLHIENCPVLYSLTGLDSVAAIEDRLQVYYAIL